MTDWTKLSPREQKILVAKAVQERARRHRENKLKYYEPLPQFLEAHSSPVKHRWIFGGNKAGKTYWLINEFGWWATGTHPYRVTPSPPVRMRLGTTDFLNGIRKVILPKMYECFPKDAIDHYEKVPRIMYFKNGSYIELMSYDQDVQKWGGADLELIGFDEEPSEEIYDESLMRLLVTKGEIIGSLTPVNGMTWIFDRIYNSQKKGRLQCWEVWSEDNPHVSKEELDDFMNQFTEEEREARMHGKFRQLSGVILKAFNRDSYRKGHVIQVKDLRTGVLSKYGGLDPGFTAPTAFALCGYDREGNFYVFGEHYKTKQPIPQNAKEILGTIGKDKPYYIVIDPSAEAQKPGEVKSEADQYRDEFRKEEIPIFAGSNQDHRHGIRIWEKLIEDGKFYVTENCVNVLMEAARWHWDSYRISLDRNPKDKPAKAYDHLMQGILYVLMSGARYRRPGSEVPIDDRVRDPVTGY